MDVSWRCSWSRGPAPTSFIHSPHGKLRRVGAIPSALLNWHRASLLSPDHRAAINRHHVASFYEKVRGKTSAWGEAGGRVAAPSHKDKACAALLLLPGAGSEAGAEWQPLGSRGASFGGSRSPSSGSCPQPSSALLLGLQAPCLARRCGCPGSFSDRAVRFYC